MTNTDHCSQALPIVRNLPDPTGTAAVVSQPGGAPTPGAAGSESSGGAGGVTAPTSATCGSGQGYEKNVNMALNEIAMRNGCVPEWTMVSESGPQHQKVNMMMMYSAVFNFLSLSFRDSPGN